MQQPDLEKGLLKYKGVVKGITLVSNMLERHDEKMHHFCNYCKNHHKLQFFQQLKKCTSRCHNDKDEKLHAELNKELLEKSFVKPDSEGNIALNFKSIE